MVGSHNAVSQDGWWPSGDARSQAAAGRDEEKVDEPGSGDARPGVAGADLAGEQIDDCGDVAARDRVCGDVQDGRQEVRRWHCRPAPWREPP